MLPGPHSKTWSPTCRRVRPWRMKTSCSNGWLCGPGSISGLIQFRTAIALSPRKPTRSMPRRGDSRGSSFQLYALTLLMHPPSVDLGLLRDSRPPNPRQQLRELWAVHDADVLLGRELLRAVGDFARRDVEALVCLTRALRFMELAQRLDAGASRFPALARDERGAPRFGQLEVGRRAGEPAHRVAVAAESVFQRAREIAPRHRAQRLERIADPRGARLAKLAPAGDGADHEERSSCEHGIAHRDRWQHEPHYRNDSCGDRDADPPRRAQQDREERILRHLEFHVPPLGRRSAGRSPV